MPVLRDVCVMCRGHVRSPSSHFVDSPLISPLDHGHPSEHSHRFMAGLVIAHLLAAMESFTGSPSLQVWGPTIAECSP